MQCPFRYRLKWKQFSFGVDPEFMDYAQEIDAKAERWLDEHYPTCWAKFLHWLGVR